MLLISLDRPIRYGVAPFCWDLRDWFDAAIKIFDVFVLFNKDITCQFKFNQITFMWSFELLKGNIGEINAKAESRTPKTKTPSTKSSKHKEARRPPPTTSTWRAQQEEPHHHEYWNSTWASQICWISSTGSGVTLMLSVGGTMTSCLGLGAINMGCALSDSLLSSSIGTTVLHIAKARAKPSIIHSTFTAVGLPVN